MEYYPRERTEHIAKVMRLDPRREWLASKLYNNSYTWCSCREDHNINPPCGSVKQARATVDMLLSEGQQLGLILGLSSYTPPLEPRYGWEEFTKEDLKDMDDMEYAEFIRSMPTKELDDFIEWKRRLK